MPEIYSFRFFLGCNNDPDMWWYALFGIENEDVQLPGTCFLYNGMIYQKIIGYKGYRFIPLDSSRIVFLFCNYILFIIMSKCILSFSLEQTLSILPPDSRYTA